MSNGDAITRLQERERKGREQIAKLTNENEKSKSRNRLLIARLDREIKHREEQLAGFTRLSEKYLEESDAKEAEIKKLNDDYARLEAYVEPYEAERREVKRLNVQCTALGKNCKGHASDIRRWEAAVERLKARLKNSHGEIEAVHRILLSYGIRGAAAHDKAFLAGEEIERLKAELAKAQAELKKED